MENDTMLYLLVILAGFGGGAVASRGSLAGYTPNPDDTRPPRPRCPWCPPLLGALLAVVIWLLIGRKAGAEGALVTASVVSFIVGTAGGAISDSIQSFGGQRR
jgi:Na+/proline symporter